MEFDSVGHFNMEMDIDDVDIDMTDVDSDASSIFSPTSNHFASTPSTPPSVFAQVASTPETAGSSFHQTIAQTPTPANNAFAPLPDYSGQMDGVERTPSMATSSQPVALPAQAAAAQQQHQQQHQPAQAATVPDTPRKNGTIPFTLQAASNTQLAPAQATAVPNAPPKNRAIPFTLLPAATQQQQQQQPAQGVTIPGTPPKNGTIPFTLKAANNTQQAPAQAATVPNPPPKNGAIPFTLLPATTPQQLTPPPSPPRAAATLTQPASGQAPGNTQPANPQMQAAPSPASIFKQPDCITTMKVAPRWEKIRTWDEIKTSAGMVFKPIEWPWPVKLAPRWVNVKSWAETEAAMKAAILERDLENIIQLTPSVHITDPDQSDSKDSTTFGMFIGHETNAQWIHDRNPMEAVANDIANAYSRPFAIGADWSSNIAPYPVTPAAPVPMSAPQQSSVPSRPITQDSPAVSAPGPRGGSTPSGPTSNGSLDEAAQSIGSQSTGHGKGIAASPNLDVAHLRSILAMAQPMIEKLKKSNPGAQSPAESPNQNNKPSASIAAYPAAPLPATVSFFGQEFSLSAPTTTEVSSSQENACEVGSDEDSNADTEFDFANHFSRSARAAAASPPSFIPHSAAPSASAQLLPQCAAADVALPSIEVDPPVADSSTAGLSTATAPAASGGYPRVDNGLRYDQAYATKMMRRMVFKTVPRLVAKILFPDTRHKKSDQKEEAKITLDDMLEREIHEISLEDVEAEYENKDTLSHTALSEVFRDWFEDYMLVELQDIVAGGLNESEEVGLKQSMGRAFARYIARHPPTHSDGADESDSDYDSSASEGGDF